MKTESETPSETTTTTEVPVVKAPTPIDDLSANIKASNEQNMAALQRIVSSMTSELSELKRAMQLSTRDHTRELSAIKKTHRPRRRAANTKEGPGMSAFNTPVRIHPTLLKYLGKPMGTVMTRNEVHKSIIDIMKERNLQVVPGKKNKWRLDESLQRLFKTNETECSYLRINYHTKGYIESKNNPFPEDMTQVDA